jgi:phenylpropionate dioxygenase-like ring-hydroxylating dioxygenase large terminal subunit
MKNFPYQTMPTGWFQIGWSDELVVGEVKPMQYFGRDLIAYRGASGQVHVLDAHCAHLGAHLGYGGTVVDDDIVCPFHHWRWNCEGCTVDIPYSQRKTQAKRIGVWHVREVEPFVLVWHDAAGEPPGWEPEKLQLPFPLEDYHPVWPDGARRYAGVAMQPQLLIENLPDIFHFRYVHGTVRVPAFLEFSTDGHRIKSVQRFTEPLDAQGEEISPTAAQGEFDVYVQGLGILLTNINGLGDTSQSACITPIDGETSDFHFTVFVPRGIPERQRDALYALQYKLVVEDFIIWEHLAYQERPPFAPEEAGPYQAVRRWVPQFHPHEPAAK